MSSMKHHFWTTFSSNYWHLRFSLIGGLVMTALGAYSQQQNLLSGERTTEIIRRYSILYPQDWYFDARLTNRKDLTQWAWNLVNTRPLSAVELSDIRYILMEHNDVLPSITPVESEQLQYIDSTHTFQQYATVQQPVTAPLSSPRIESRKPILRHFYRTPLFLYEVDDDAFTLRVQPLLTGMLGSSNLFENHRGLKVRASIDRKIWLETSFLESQSFFPTYLNQWISKFKTIPGQGLYKNYSSSLFGVKNGYDYLNAQANIQFNITRHIQGQFGYGQNPVGYGIRSLFLSDFANNYLYLKLNTRVWKFNYQNLFGELAAESANGKRGDDLLPKKYFAAHHLSLNVLPRLEVGLYETVVFNRSRQFELQYLNPVILYRSVEHNLGSPDNVLLGLDASWIVADRVRLYGQLILDEFRLKEIRANRGWWGNKSGWQLGMEYTNVASIDHLDLQVEWNRVRPYTYAHRDSLSNYSHFFQPLAHPLGANFNELLAVINYRPFTAWKLELKLSKTNQGLDRPGENWGSNILLPYTTRQQDFGNTVGQGVDTDVFWGNFDVQFEFKPGLFLQGFYLYRNQKSSLVQQSESYFGIGICWNRLFQPVIL